MERDNDRTLVLVLPPLAGGNRPLLSVIDTIGLPAVGGGVVLVLLVGLVTPVVVVVVMVDEEVELEFAFDAEEAGDIIVGMVTCT
jgi:hypothetical protein